MRYEGVTYAAPEGYRPLQLDVWVPASATPPPLVVWIHGGAWLFGDRRYLPETLRPNQLFEELINVGLAVVALTAQRPDLEGTLGVLDESSAVDVVVDWYGVADLTVKPQPDSAAQPPPELLTEPQDILVGGQDQHAYAAASPITYVTPAAPPFLLVHGTADAVVPYLQSEVLARALTEAGVPVRLVPIEGADHIFNGHDDIDGVVRLSVDYFAEALLPARRTRSS